MCAVRAAAVASSDFTLASAYPLDVSFATARAKVDAAAAPLAAAAELFTVATSAGRAARVLFMAAVSSRFCAKQSAPSASSKGSQETVSSGTGAYSETSDQYSTIARNSG